MPRPLADPYSDIPLDQKTQLWFRVDKRAAALVRANYLTQHYIQNICATFFDTLTAVLIDEFNYKPTFDPDRNPDADIARILARLRGSPTRRNAARAAGTVARDDAGSTAGAPSVSSRTPTKRGGKRKSGGPG